jgi:hypothetical protein
LKVNKYMVGALAAVILIGMYFTFFSGGPKKIASVTPALQVPQAEAQPDVIRVRETKPAPVGPDARWDRDPFTLPKFVTEKRQEKKLPVKLTAILEGRNGRVAIIDNEVVAKGDVIGGERVQEIGKDRVVLVQDNVKRVISMQEAP